MDNGERAPVRARWARLRFGVIGSVLASPPGDGELTARLQELADRNWEHPTTGNPIRFSFSTIERWYYAARGDHGDPYNKLARKTRKDAGSHPTMNEALCKELVQQYQDHPCWTYQLQWDNLRALATHKSELGHVPSVATVARWMKDHGLYKQKKKPKAITRVLQQRERRSWEVRYVNQLWHADFHECSRAVVDNDGNCVRPWLLGIMDDHSRLACHLQWYWSENAENLIHGFCQAAYKRGLCAALLTDGGGAQKAGETQQGLMRLGVVHDMTLANTPEQNGKQENFWTRIEQRLMPMLEGVPVLSLRLLNEATQAWVEREYNRACHSETQQSPMDRFLGDHNIGRECPDSERLRDVFRIQQSRAQRLSDCTVSVEGVRYELPSRYRALRRVTVRYARWDKSNIDLVDPRTEKILCTLYPLDRQRNADRQRRDKEPMAEPGAIALEQGVRPSGLAPLLRELMTQYAASGLPPAYLPKDEEDSLSEVTQ